MKESQAYLHYFRRFFSLYLALILLWSGVGYFIQSHKPSTYSVMMTYEVWQPALSCPAEEFVQAADHITQVARSRNLSQQLFGTNTASLEVQAVRMAPFAVRTTTSSQSLALLQMEAPKLSQYLLSTYPLNTVGMEYPYTT